MQNKQHICGSLPCLNNIYGSGRNSSFVIQELIMQDFYVFQKIKSSELQCHLEQDKQQLRPCHIIFINYLDLDQAYATHEFQVQSKSLYQTVVSKTQENSRLKTRYLKGITIEQLFIISIARDYPQSPFYLFSSQKQKTRRILFLFCFQNLRSHLINIYNQLR